MCLSPVDDDSKSKKVKVYIFNDSWDTVTLNSLLPFAVVNSIVGIFPPHRSSGLDSSVCNLMRLGKFSLSSLLSFFKGLDSSLAVQHQGFNWRLIWQFNGSPQIKTFMWLAAHGKLLTNSQ